MGRDKKPEPNSQTEAQPKDELRIVLFGHGNAKSDIIRIIDQFPPDASPECDAKKGNQCQKINKIINNKKVVIINTPDLDAVDKKELFNNIKFSVALAKPGPHMFLFVERIQHPLGKKLKALKDFQKTFGEQVNDFTMLVFSTDWKQEEKNIDVFKELIYPFNHRCFVHAEDGVEQATELFDEIEKMREEASQASAHFYTPRMLWEAQKAVKQQDKEDENEREKCWSNIRDRCYVLAAHIGATVGMVISDLLKLDSASAAGLGSIVAVSIFAVVYLVAKSKSKTKQQSDSKQEKEPTSVRIS